MSDMKRWKTPILGTWTWKACESTDGLYLETERRVGNEHEDFVSLLHCRRLAVWQTNHRTIVGVIVISMMTVSMTVWARRNVGLK